MKKLIVIILGLFISLSAFAQEISFNGSLGPSLRNNIKYINEIISLSKEDVSTFLFLEYVNKHKFGVQLGVNFTGYSLDISSYRSYVYTYYPDFYFLHGNTGYVNQIDIRAGGAYHIRFFNFEIIPAFQFGRYLRSIAIDPDYIIKHKGSNLIREFDYKFLSVKNLFTYTAMCSIKYNFQKWGLNFNVDYCLSYPKAKYLLIEKEYTLVKSEKEVIQTLNLSNLNYRFGFHYFISK